MIRSELNIDFILASRLIFKFTGFDLKGILKIRHVQNTQSVIYVANSGLFPRTAFLFSFRFVALLFLSFSASLLSVFAAALVVGFMLFSDSEISKPMAHNEKKPPLPPNCQF